MANAISSPLPLLADPRGGLLNGGFVWLGVENLDPETNPIAAYWDAAGTQPAAQPLRTTAGMVSRNGAPAHVHVNAPYSLTVKDSRGRLILHLPAASAAAAAADSAAAAAATASAAALTATQQASTATTAASTATTAASTATTQASAASASASSASASAAAASASATSASASASAAAASAAYGPFFNEPATTFVSNNAAGNTLGVDANVTPNGNGTRRLGDVTSRWEGVYADKVVMGGTAYPQLIIQAGPGSPEGVVFGTRGYIWIRTDGGAGTTFYVKETASGNTGWAAK